MSGGDALASAFASKPLHTIGGTRGVGGVLGEGQASLVCCIVPHSLRGGTFADDSRRFVIVVLIDVCSVSSFSLLGVANT